MALKKMLIDLLERAKFFGLSESDIDTANMFLSNREYGLCFDTVVIQMHENDIQIDSEYYNLIVRIAQKMDLPESDYNFMIGLILKH